MLDLFGMEGVGIDFGKQASGPQGPKRVAEPPKPRWRTMTDDAARKLFADWTAEDFESAIQWSEKSLSDASPADIHNLEGTNLGLFRPTRKDGSVTYRECLKPLVFGQVMPGRLCPECDAGDR